MRSQVQPDARLVVTRMDLRDAAGRWREEVRASVRLPDGRHLPVRTTGVAPRTLAHLLDGPVTLTDAQRRQPWLSAADAAAAVSRRPALALDAAAPRFYILPCQFAGFPGIDRAFYEQSLAAAFPGAAALITASSRGATSIAGSVVGPPVTLAQPPTYYFQNLGTNVGTGPFTDGLARDIAFVTDCLDAAAAAGRPVDLAQYDGVGVQVNVRLAGAWAYRAMPIPRGGATYVRRALLMSNFAEAGIYAHEIGHTYGFRHVMARDLYPYQAWWSCMSACDFPLRSGVQTFGALFSAVERSQAGWNAPRLRKVAPGGAATVSLTYPSLPPVAGDADAVLVEIPTPAGTDSLFVEARRQVTESFEHVIPGDAVVLYLVSGGRVNVVDVDDTDSPNDAGAQWLVGETYAASGVRVTVREKVATGFVVEVAFRGGLRVIADTLRRVHAGFPVRDSILVAGASGAVTYAVRGLPAGLAFDPATRRITGTPTQDGTAWLIAQDAGSRDSMPYRVERTTGPWLGTARTLVQGVAVRDTLAVFGWTRRGYQAIEYWTATAAPPGLTIAAHNDEGVDKVVLTGTPATLGTTTVTFTVRQAGATVTQPITLQVVREPLRLTGDTLRRYQHGYAVRDTLQAAGGGGAARSWRIRSGTLPAGLQLVDGVIAGSAEQAGDARVEVEVREAGGDSATGWFRLRTAASLSLVTTDSVRPPATFGAAYADTLRVTAVGGVAVTWSATGLPRGVALSPAGVVTGAPDSAGTFRAVARATAAYPARSVSVELPLLLTVRAPAFTTEAMVDQLLLGGTALPAAAVRYLDQAGNGNGRLDVGDVLRQLRRQGLVPVSAGEAEAMAILLQQRRTP